MTPTSLAVGVCEVVTIDETLGGGRGVRRPILPSTGCRCPRATTDLYPGLKHSSANVAPMSCLRLWLGWLVSLLRLFLRAHVGHACIRVFARWRYDTDGGGWLATCSTCDCVANDLHSIHIYLRCGAVRRQRDKETEREPSVTASPQHRRSCDDQRPTIDDRRPTTNDQRRRKKGRKEGRKEGRKDRTKRQQQSNE